LKFQAMLNVKDVNLINNAPFEEIQSIKCHEIIRKNSVR